MKSENNPRLPNQSLTARSIKTTYLVIILLVVGMTSQVFAAATPYYIIQDASTSLGVDGSATLPASNTTNGFYKTTFSTTSPTGSSTQIRNSGATAGTWTLLGRVYTPVLSTTASTQITTTGSDGTVYLRSGSTSDQFQFLLVDYNPSGSASCNTNTCYSTNKASALASSTIINSPSSSSAATATLNFGSNNFIVPATHRLAFEIWYNPFSNGYVGRLYCNSTSNNSFISITTAPITLRAINLQVGAGGSVNSSGTHQPYDTGVTTNGPGSTTYNIINGSTETFTITAPVGYILKDVTEDTGSGPVSIKSQVSGSGTLIRSNITQNRSYVVTFQTTPTYSITATVNGIGGSIVSPPGAGTTLVNQGSGLSYTFIANPGWMVSNVTDNGASAGAVSAFSFTNIQANHNLVVTFIESPALNNYCSKPAFLSNSIPPNVMIMLSVESPMSGVGNPQIQCSGLPSDLNFRCGYNMNIATVPDCGNWSLGCYSPNTNYTGYFISNKCYTYNNGTGNSSSSNALTGLFSPSGNVNASGACSNAWSGNFLNFATTMALDNFRRAFTGGNRDPIDQTVIVGGMQPYTGDNSGSPWEWNPQYVRLDSSSSYTPYSGTIYLKRHNMGFSICKSNASSCTISPASVSASETDFPVNTSTADGYSLRIQACSATGGTEGRCDTASGHPVGILQKYADTMRFGLTSYAINNNSSSDARDGGVLRANMKWLLKTIPYGMLYNDSTGAAVTCSNAVGCPNTEYEIENDGTFVANPMNASLGHSGLINYINKFGYYSGQYRVNDPNAELYYETIRYFMAADSTRSGHPLGPSNDNYCLGLGAIDDGFPVYCGLTDNGTTLNWRDPFLYACSQSFIIAINDANPHSDKRIPGTPFKSPLPAGDSGDYCVGNTAHPCDNDLSVLTGTWPSSTKTDEKYDPFPDGLNSVPGSEYWTDKVGKIEYDKFSTVTSSSDPNYNGFKTLGSIGAAYFLDPSTNSYTSTSSSDIHLNLGRVIQTGRGNVFYTSGLAYFAHVNDLRKDLAGTQSITTYMIDTQEPYSYASGSMIVGPKNLLYLAAKYGGFDDKNGDGKPYDSLSSTNGCGGHSTTPNPYCSEWDSNNDGYPDNYFFASNSSAVETGLTYAFNDMQKHMASGTAASILSNSEGSGANLLQAVFYPLKMFNNDSNGNATSANWIGEVNNMWYYIDPFIGNSSIREDTAYVSGNTHQLDLAQDLIAQFNFDGKDTNVELFTDSKGKGQMDNPQPSGYPLIESPDNMKAIWKAGQLLWQRSSARNIYTTTDGATLTSFSGLNTNSSTVQGLLQAGTPTEAGKIISFTGGTDQSGYRSRTVSWLTTSGTAMSSVWRLGDVITSTPRIQSTVPLNAYGLDSPTGYGDTTYNAFTGGTAYNTRGMSYLGANDGMLHAFKQGILNVTVSGTVKATLTGANLGTEQWAFIPKNALPYLKYYADPTYNHIYSVDGRTSILDLSIMKPTGCTSSYWDCPKTDATSWATILLGSMGLGGASRISTDSTCTDCVRTPITDPSATTKGVGYSSYFALDVTGQYFNSDTLNTTYTSSEGTGATPKLLWEFADPRLGYSLTGIAVVRINSNSDSATSRKNGRWIGIIPSGPTGPIDTTSHQFKGHSDQNLMIFVIDLKDGTLLSKDTHYPSQAGPIDTGIPLAFAGSVTSGVIDTDRWNINAPGKGNYQDDAVYVGYTKADTSVTPNTWTKGGVLRIVIPENTDPGAIDPTNWKISKVIDNIGPVTTNIAKLQDRKNHNLWLYFGTGRYFYQTDDSTDQQALYGVREGCYQGSFTRTCSDNSTQSDTINDCVCADSAVSPTSDPVGVPMLDGNSISSVLTNQSGSSISDALTNGNGWYVNLSLSSGSYGSERNVTDPVALTNGLVLFTTFMPTTDICNYGGNSYLWGFKYDTGFTPLVNSLLGKVTIQESTGAFEEKDLATVFNDPNQANRRSTVTMTGKPPGDPPPVITNSNLKPVKKILHIMER